MSCIKYDSNIFENLLQGQKDDELLEDIESQDETESVHIEINDDLINRLNCSLIAYNVQVNENDDAEAYNPKKNPDKAIDILMEYPQKNFTMEIFLDTPSLEWDSLINNKDKLSPEQMEQFFKTNFYRKLYNSLNKIWPSSDKFFCNLLNAIKIKKYKTDWTNEEKIDEGAYQFKQHNIHKGKAREKNAAGEQIRTNSGRLIIDFQDMNVKKGKFEEYYSWPGNNVQDKFKWSRWKDWKNQKPFIRCRFAYGIGINNDIIGVSLTPFEEDDTNRGFISYNLSLTPILQYLTPGETQDILNLSIMRRFIKEAIRRIQNVLDIPDEEIFDNIKNKDKITIGDIRKTKAVLKNTLKAAKDLRVNNFIYT